MIPLYEQAALTTLLTQPHRTYHNINHINDCLVEMEAYFKAYPEHENLRWAVTHMIWYHDAIYNPYAPPGLNETQSAELFIKQHYPTGGASRHTWDQYNGVINAIEKTSQHLKTHTEEDVSLCSDDQILATHIMLDIDLSGFGKPWDIYRKNTDKIRGEYYNTSERDFTLGRIKFLEALNLRESFYYTQFFKDLYHAESKHNIEIELELLK